jgi:transposase-like protein
VKYLNNIVEQDHRKVKRLIGSEINQLAGKPGAIIGKQVLRHATLPHQAVQDLKRHARRGAADANPPLQNQEIHQKASSQNEPF